MDSDFEKPRLKKDIPNDDGIYKAVWNYIDQSGIPLELEVLNALSKSSGWLASPNSHYTDDEDENGPPLSQILYS